MKHTHVCINFKLEDVDIRKHIEDSATGEDTYTFGVEALDELREFIMTAGIDAQVFEDGHVSLVIGY